MLQSIIAPMVAMSNARSAAIRAQEQATPPSATTPPALEITVRVDMQRGTLYCVARAGGRSVTSQGPALQHGGACPFWLGMTIAELIQNLDEQHGINPFNPSV